MATVVNKDFKIKQGLIVEGSTGTINGYDILTKNQDDQNYIIGLIGGSATSANTADSVVLRNGTGSFAAQDLTLDGTLYATNIESNGTINIVSNANDIVLNADGWVYLGNTNAANRVATRGRVDDLIGDPTVDSSTGNTITDRITSAANAAEYNANSATDLKLQDYTKTQDLDTTIDGYGYLKSADLPTMYTDADAVNAISAKLGQGIEYSGTAFDVQVGTGIGINGSNQLEIDRNTVNNWYDSNGAASNVQDNLNDHTGASSNVHGVSGDVVGTSDIQSLSNKTFTGQTNFQSAGGAGGTNNHINVDNSTGKMTVTSGYALDITASNDIAITSNNGDIVLNADGHAYVTSASAGNEIATQSYVDNAVSGLTWKDAVHLLWNDPNATLTGNTGTLIIDNHAALTASNNGYRILISSGSNAGLWSYSDTGSTWTLTRTADADAFEELIGAAVFIMEGDQYGQTSWVQSNHYLSNFTGQTWTQFSGTGSVVAGTGINVNGLTVSVDRTTVDPWYEAAGNVADHAALTTTHGVSGDIVGTTDTQTLSNKKLTNPQIDGEVQLLDSTGTYAGYITMSSDELVIDTDARNIVLWPENGGDVYINNSGSNNNIVATQGWSNNAFDANGAAVSAVSDHASDTVTHGVTGNIVGTSDSQTLTHKIISGTDNTISNIANSSLTNSSITVNGFSTALGDSVTLDTDDISEGTSNLYYTASRAKAEAANLLVNATKTNIVITQDLGHNLTITAENGVADSTTDDLAEGSNHLYFTNSRAVSALEAVVPNFTEVDINSLVSQVAATTGNITTASQVTAYSFSKVDYRSAKFLVKCAYGSHTEIAEVLLTLDSSDNIAITEYAVVGTNGSSMTVSADIDGSNVRLRVTTVNNNSTVTVMGTLVA